MSEKYGFKEMRGKARNEDKDKTCVKCGNCQIRIYDFNGSNCPCCNNKLRVATRYKPRNLVHKLEDTEKNVKISQTVEMKDGSLSEIWKVVDKSELPIILDHPVSVAAAAVGVVH